MLNFQPNTYWKFWKRYTEHPLMRQTRKGNIYLDRNGDAIVDIGGIPNMGWKPITKNMYYKRIKQLKEGIEE